MGPQRKEVGVPSRSWWGLTIKRPHWRKVMVRIKRRLLQRLQGHGGASEEESWDDLKVMVGTQ